jgi:hypothetical protein
MRCAQAAGAPGNLSRRPRQLLAWIGAGIGVLGCLLVAGVGIRFLAGTKPHEWRFDDEKPAVGDEAPAFVLYDLEGHKYQLDPGHLARPVVIEFGSWT